MDVTNIKWWSAIPINPPFDAQKRIQELRSSLNLNHPEHEPEQQHFNIKLKLLSNSMRMEKSMQQNLSLL